MKVYYEDATDTIVVGGAPISFAPRSLHYEFKGDRLAIVINSSGEMVALKPWQRYSTRDEVFFDDQDAVLAYLDTVFNRDASDRPYDYFTSVDTLLSMGGL